MLAPVLFLFDWLLVLAAVAATPGRTPDLFGLAVASIGDLDGDGLSELAIADPDTGGPWRGWFPRRGAVWVVSGETSATIYRLAADEPGDPFATALLGPGDTTGDGVPDLVAAGPRRAHVVDGASGEIVYTIECTRRRSGAYYALASSPALCALGDVDGDCCADFALGSPYDESRGLDAGLVLIVSGRTGTFLGELHGTPGERTGIALANAGDLDGDGRDDLAVTSYPYPYLGIGPGTVRVWTGLGRRMAYEVRDEVPELGYFGVALASAGDADGDGVPDLAIAGYRRVRVVSGVDGGPLWERRGVQRTFGTRLASLATSPRHNGRSLVIGAPNNLWRAPAFVVEAGTGGHLHESPSWLGTAADLRVFLPLDPDLGLGAGECVAPAGDLDRDGLVDYAVGAASPQVSAPGCVAVFSARTGKRIRFFHRWGLLSR